MRAIVCGGRAFADHELVWTTLKGFPLSCIIHGAARGADTLAQMYAIVRGIAHEAYPANWQGQGKAAGILRNMVMLKHGKPDMVIAFPGGAGTAHMVKIARIAKVPVVEVVRVSGPAAPESTA